MLTLHCHVPSFMNTQPVRSVFFVSDGTGITAETLGHSLLAQFTHTPFRQYRYPFVDTLDKALDCARHIKEVGLRNGVRPIVFSTLVNPETVQGLQTVNALFIDLFEQFIGPLEQELQEKSTHAIGRFHGVGDDNLYKARIEAINFAITNDDGIAGHSGLNEANVILVGVSRSGKTPTSLYLAMQYGIKAANYPLIPDDFERNRLPGELGQFRPKLFGLTIAPERLTQIRQERRPNSHYASLENCRYEIDAAQKLMKRENVPWLDSTNKSIEEISATIMHTINLHKEEF